MSQLPETARPSRILHRSMRAPPPVALSGNGVWLTDRDGREIIDGCGGAAVACLGHRHPRVLEAMARQGEALAYVHSSFFTTDAAEELAEMLVGHEPGGLVQAYFVSSGSEAVEAAIKLSRQYFLEIGEPQRRHVISRLQSYHGNTLGALAAGGNLPRRAAYAPLLSGSFSHVSAAFSYHGQHEGETEAAYVARLAAELEAEFQRIGPGNVAAFMAEPVVGATSGCVPAPDGYFRAVREICDRHGCLLILDEVMCGMGRTGTMHAWEQEGVTPDIQAIAKGLGGGYQPIGGLLIAGRVIEALRAGSGVFQHGHTYLAHPIACAAALAVQQVIRDDGLIARVQELGQHLDRRLHDRFGNHRHVGDIRGRGLLQAIELVADRSTKEAFDPALKLNLRVKEAALELGLACYPGAGTIDGRRGDHILIAPPYISELEHIDLIVDRLGAAVDKALSGVA